MPEPLATTKRKFHKLLDSLTKHANATATAPPEEAQKDLSARERLILASERVNKRQRVDEQPDGTTSSPSIRSSSSIKSTLRARKPPQSTSTRPFSSQALPAFSPWSQDSFLERLRTFSSVALWHPKPEAINEVVWAKRGWRCVAVNTVACVGSCEQRVTVDLQRQHLSRSPKQDDGQTDKLGVAGKELDPPREQSDSAKEESAGEDDDDSVLQAFTQRYAEEVIRGHSDTCLWRRAGCKDDIYRLQVVRPAIWKPQLHERYISLLKVQNSINAINTMSQCDTSSNHEIEEILSTIDPPNDAEESLDQGTRTQAAKIAMHGWYGTKDSHADLLQCRVCFQRVGLWMYQPGYHRRRTAVDEADDKTPSSVDQDNGVALDLLDMHREYCPWRNEKSQCASGSLSGLNACEILARVVGTYLRERRRNVSDMDPVDDEQLPGLTPNDESELGAPPKLTTEEVDKLDREREGRLQKLKRLLTLKRPRKIEQSV